MPTQTSDEPERGESQGRIGRATRENLGFLLAKASQRWNELLYERFVAAGFPDVRPSYGSILLPLFEEDGLRMASSRPAPA